VALIVLALTTDGRSECIERTIPSLLERVEGLDGPRLIFDDSGDRAYQRWLRRRFGGEGFEVCGAGRRHGQPRMLGAMWRRLAGAEFDGHEWVMHVEDDFVFERGVDLAALRAVLEPRPHLAQMALLRQPWFEGERRAGGIVERDPEAYEAVAEGEHRWLEHRLWFTLNPCLYRRRLCRRGWPLGRRHEWSFGRSLCADPEVRFGIWGDGSPWVTHIGARRAQGDR
jgi:hypothetical protein